MATPATEQEAATVALRRAVIPGVLLEAPTGTTYPATIIREGVYVPGLGNPDGDAILIPFATIAAMAASGEGKRVDLNHREKDVAGRMTNLRAEAPRLRADLVLEPEKPKFRAAVDFVEQRRAEGKVPNVSIEVEDTVLKDESGVFQGRRFTKVLVSAVLEGVAILPEGACNDRDGCGIGLQAHTHLTLLASPPATAGGEGTTKEQRTCMCDKTPADYAALQSKVSDLEASLKAKTEEATALTAKVQGFEAAEVQAIREAADAAAPPGTTVKELFGDNPSKEVLTAALKAWQVAKPKEAPAPTGNAVGMGRKTAAAGRDAKPDAPLAGEPNQEHLAAMRLRLGLKDKPSSKMPAQMQRNTAKVLTGVEAAAPAQ